MKHHQFTLLSKITLIVLFFTLMVDSSYSQIVSYSCNNTLNATGGLPANYPGGVLTTTASGIGADYGYAYSYGWDSGSGAYKEWDISPFSTEGYYNIQVSAFVWSDTDGPRDFNLEYKIGSGGTWNVAGSYTVTSNGETKVFTLPTTCNNQPSIFVRWIATSYTSVSGGTIPSSSQYSYIQTISVLGNLPTVPTTQANTIAIVSETPTTITIDCSPGNGDNRIILISKNNDFVDPTDNQIFMANTDYSGGKTAPQVIYNGSGTHVVVTVDHATDQFYFRAYEYFYNLGLTRYLTTKVINVTEGDNNPRLCALELITANVATNIGLVAATIGGTIQVPLRSNISSRGVVWSTSPNVSTSSNKKIASGYLSTAGGIFSIKYPASGPGQNNLPRGSTIYYKAFVTNQTGTIYSNELSFSNVPVFSGIGNWEDYTKWNVQQIPGANGDPTYGSSLDSPIINGNCTITATNSVTNLTINSGNKLTVSTGKTLKVVGTLTNSAGNSGILLKAAKDSPNGSLIWASGTPAGSVEMWSKSYIDSKYHWQYFGIPVTSVNSASVFSGTGVRVRQYNEANHDPNGQDVGLWLPSGSGASMATTNETMYPVVGYEVTQPVENKFTFSGTLNHSDVISYPLGYTTGADWKGCNIIANPFVAALPISSITMTNTDGNVYLYNAGSRDEWTSNGGSSTDGTNPGQYTASNGTFAGTLGTPAEIPSMQGFLVIATSAGATISMPNSSVAGNTTAQRTKALNQTNIVGSRIDVIGTTSNYSDKMWLFTSTQCTHNFDLGYDGYKMLGSALVPQIYAAEPDGDYQIDAVNNVNNTILKFQPGSETSFKLVFTHQNINTQYSAIYLVDLLENKTIDVTADGSEYSFTSSPSTVPAARFKIIATPLTVTGIDSKETNPCLNVFSSGKQLFINNPTSERGSASIYNLAGVKIRELILEPNRISSGSDLPAGIYIVNANTQNQKVTQRLVIQ